RCRGERRLSRRYLRRRRPPVRGLGRGAFPQRPRSWRERGRRVLPWSFLDVASESLQKRFPVLAFVVRRASGAKWFPGEREGALDGVACLDVAQDLAVRAGDREASASQGDEDADRR